MQSLKYANAPQLEPVEMEELKAPGDLQKLVNLTNDMITRKKAKRADKACQGSPHKIYRKYNMLGRQAPETHPVVENLSPQRREPAFPLWR